MSQYQFQGQVYISDNLDPTTSDPAKNFISLQGDTIRILEQRPITNSNDPGFPGEICIDGDYIYYCIDGDGVSGTWKRVALSTW